MQRKDKSKAAKLLPTIERLREVFRYDPETGDLIWISMVSRRAPIGTKAGSPNSYGYLTVGLDGVRNLAVHRVIWFMVTGEWPPRIDHRDLDRVNNRWENLRLATRSQNAANTAKPATNTSGIKGVYLRRGRFAAQIMKDQRVIYLGTFDTLEAGGSAYAAKGCRVVWRIC